MKLWTMLAGLAVVGIMAASAFAQGGGGGRGGRGGFGMQAPPAYDAIVSADVGVKDGDPITAAVLLKVMKKNLPADAPEGASANLDVMAVFAMARVVKASGGDPLTVASLPKEDYTKGVAALPTRGGGKGKGKGKGKKTPETTSSN